MSERRAIVGLEGYYEVDEEDVVYRVARGKGGIVGPLKPCLLHNGYLTVYPSIGARRRHLAVHQAVAGAFIGPRNGRQVNHKNGLKTDNRAENLEYVEPAQNLAHAASMGLLQRGRDRWNARLTEEKVVEIRALRRAGHLYRDIAQQAGVSIGAVADVVRGTTWAWLKEVPL